MDQAGTQDSPLSSTSNIIGILTFLIAILAALYARLSYLRNSQNEYIRVKTSLLWYKTESKWLAELLESVRGPPSQKQNKKHDDQHYDDERKDMPAAGPSGLGFGLDGSRFDRFEGRRRPLSRRSTMEVGPEGEMFDFVMGDLLNLEKRILEIVEDVDRRSEKGGRTFCNFGFGGFNLGGGGSGGGSSSNNGVYGDGEGGEPSVAVNWIGVRTKCLELVRQREALTTRVQFLQMSLVSARLKELEHRMERREMRMEEGILNFERDMEQVVRRVTAGIREEGGVTTRHPDWSL